MITLSTVTQFLETVGRTRASTVAELDEMNCIWTGPTTLSDISAPIKGSIHPEYPGMQVFRIQKTREVAGITKFDIGYKGRFDATTTTFVGETLVDVGANEQELQYQTPGQTRLALIGSPPTPSLPNATYQWELFLRLWVLRYTGVSTTIRYVCRPKPAVTRFQSLASPTILSQFIRLVGKGSSTIYVSDSFGGISPNPLTGTPIGYIGPSVYCSSFRATAATQDWYQVTETWSTRYLPGNVYG